ncbi:MAG: translocation/assembly module TamB domain-containing protein [Nitrospirae bacterium]|nr:translocation/assembly module TamB domain-containing protein [Nitrospirota bacterium]
MQNKLMKRLSLLFAAILFIALMFFLLRGPYLSNSIKKVIQPVLENAIGEKVIMDKAVINLFPFYIQMKGFKVFDKDGNRLLWVTRVRAYIDFSGLFSKQIRISRLTVREPDLTISAEKLQQIIESANKYTKNDSSKHFSVSLKSAKITNGTFALIGDEKQTIASGSGLYVLAAVKNTINAELSIKEGTFKLPDLPELSAGLNSRIKLSDKKIEILEAKVYSSDSTLETNGEIKLSSDGGVEKGFFSGKANIFAETINKIFKLKGPKDGELSFSGSIDLLPPHAEQGDLALPRIKLNLKTKGWFYLQTLMELLKVQENITGRLSVDGEINGIYPEVIGKGMVELRDAVLDTLPLNYVKGEIKYEDKKFSLNKFIAKTYGGKLEGNAFLLIPSGEYSVDAHAVDINSIQFFKFIRWEPQADIEMRDDVLKFNKAVFSTSASELFLNGAIDLNEGKLNLNIEMESKDAVDLTAPYFTGLKAPVKFRGKVAGASANPEISGAVEVGSGSINGELFKEISGDLTYSTKSLSVGLLKVVQEKSIYEVSGSIAFRKANGLFSFDEPYFKGSAVIKNGSAKSLIAAVYPVRNWFSNGMNKEMPITGSVGGKLFFEGDTDEFKGDSNITLEDGMIFHQPVDRAFINAALSPDKIKFLSVEAFKAKSGVKANGTLYFDKRFDALVSSSNISLRDLTIVNKYPVDANFGLDMKGSGTFETPHVKFSLNIMDSYFKDFLVGKGNITGELIGKKLSLKSDFMEGTVTSDAAVFLSKTLPWDAAIKFKKGKYDFLLAGFLKDIPKDLSVSLEGFVNLQGKSDKFSMNSRFSSLAFSLYGYDFNNRGDIVLEFIEDTFKIKSFSIGGKNADINAVGAVKKGQNYNLAINGKINLAPLRVLNKSIESMSGQGNFLIEITGRWESPELKGEINVRDSAAVLAELPYKIGPVNGDIFIDKGRITFDSFKVDFAGGKVLLSGVGYLEGLIPKRLLVSSSMKGLRFRPVEGFDVAFDGGLFLEISPKKQSISGDINIKKAKYEKRVDWKTWLVRFKEVKETRLKQPTFMDKTLLNVHITGQDNIFIDNNIARTPVKVDLNVQGTIAQYGLIGRLDARGGTIFFRNNEFEIIEGSVDFVEFNKIVPVFHITAETFTGGYRVRLNLDGPIDKFSLSLFSDPPLSDMDILTLLTGGHISKESKGFEAGIGAGEAVAFLTGELQDVIEERFKNITGFERFEISPQTSVKGTVSPRITVGKRLLGQKLFVTYSTSIGTTEEHIIKLQYNVSKNFSIIGLRDEIGSVGTDFKYRFEFK